MRFLIALVFLFSLHLLNAQTRFYRLYSGTGFDKGEDVLALPDTTYLVAGSSGSWEENAQGFLMKLDSLGNYIWSQAYGAQESEEIKRIFYRPGLGYYLAGISNSWSTGQYDPMLIFTDLNGGQQWIKTYAHPSWERIHDGTQTADTGFVLVGERQATSGAQADVLLLRLDKNGDTLWTKSFGTTGADRANSIVRVSDTTYAVGGEWYVADSSATKGFVFMIHDNGQILWFDTLGHLSGDFAVKDLTKNLYGIQFGGDHLIEPADFDKFSGSIDLNGVILAQVAPPEATGHIDRIQQIAYLAQQDLTILGVQALNQNTFPEPYDLYFGYADAFYGFWITGWPSSTILNQGYDYIGNIRPTLDGGFVAVGMNSVIVDGQNQLNGGSNVFVLKVNGDGSAYVQTDTVLTAQQLVGLKPLSNPNKLTLSPNPASTSVICNWVGAPKWIEITNAWGQIVYKELHVPNQSISLLDWPKGIYFVRIENEVLPLLKQ